MQVMTIMPEQLIARLKHSQKPAPLVLPATGYCSIAQILFMELFPPDQESIMDRTVMVQNLFSQDSKMSPDGSRAERIFGKLHSAVLQTWFWSTDRLRQLVNGQMEIRLTIRSIRSPVEPLSQVLLLRRRGQVELL